MFTLALLVGLSVLETTHGTTIANLGFEAVTFPAPVFCGDTIHAETEVVAARASGSRPDAGIVTFEHRAFNQDDRARVLGPPQRAHAPAPGGQRERRATPRSGPLAGARRRRPGSPAFRAFVAARGVTDVGPYEALPRLDRARPRGVLVRGVGLLRACRATGGATGWSSRPSRSGAPASSPTPASTSPRRCCGDPGDEPGDRVRPRGRRAPLADPHRPARAGVAGAAGAAGRRRRPGRPGRGVAAERARDVRADARRRRASARCSRRRHPTSASRAWSTGSARSSRPCSSPPTRTSTTASGSTASTGCARSATASRRCARSSCSGTSTTRRRSTPCRARCAGPTGSHPTRRRRSSSSALPFDHPWYVLFSSGTTGTPKCIVHRAGGVLLKHLSEQQLQCDIGPGDRVCYFTTAGWMMWNWLASVLASGATLVAYDGSPAHPAAHHAVRPRRRARHHAASARRPGSSTSCARRGSARRLALAGDACARSRRPGSPLLPDGFEYVYDAVKPDVHLALDLGRHRPVRLPRGR